MRKNNKDNSIKKKNTKRASKKITNVTPKENKNINKSSKLSKKIYIGFNTRVIAYLLISLSFLILSLIFIAKSFSVSNANDVNYQENSNLDYKVYLKENDFYESKYLGKNMVYVASLIDKINIDFNYLFKIDKNSNINFNYEVVGKLVITDLEGNNTFFEKEYKLVNSTKETITNQTNYTIEKNIDIDYDYYNSLANKFRNNYGINTTSNLIVYLRINETDAKNNDFRFNNNSVMSITIPLSEKAINIKMDYKDINKKNKIISDSFVVVNNYVYTTIGIAFVLLSMYWIIHYLRLLGLTKSKKYLMNMTEQLLRQPLYQIQQIIT